MPRLTEAVTLAGRVAPSRVLFGAHETNLGDGRAISGRHVAYYAARAEGGAGVVVTETASVVEDDWPYERSPLAAGCGPGWAAVAEACGTYGTLVLAGLGHAGGQGSSAHSQSVLWAPSPVADAATRELPAEMEQPQVDAVVAGFAAGARGAVEAGLDGVEVDAGAYSLLRQFASPLTNLRDDGYGTDRLRLVREVVAAVRAEIGDGRVLSLRLSCDELAPWGGITQELATEYVAELAGALDLLVVVRGGPFSPWAYRPDAHVPPAFNAGLCAAMRAAAAGRVAVVLQGSVAHAAAAQAALDDGTADLVEMTRAQIADPALVRLVRAGTPERVRPCILCNQACLVRDDRNPLVSCVGEPRSGHETVEPAAEGTDEEVRDVLVVGGGPAGLECARVLALRGHRVELAERSSRLGGVLATASAGPGRERLRLLTGWLAAECARLGVRVRLSTDVGPSDVDRALAGGRAVVVATGSVRAAGYGVDVLDVLSAGPDALPSGAVVVDDPVGGPVGVGVAVWLAESGREVTLVTPDPVAGTRLGRSGDLVPANVRLHRLGVRREPLARVVEGRADAVTLEHVWTGERRDVACAAVVDCGHRLPADTSDLAPPEVPRAGDCVAPRTVLEAVLEGRRAALLVGARGAAAR